MQVLVEDAVDLRKQTVRDRLIIEVVPAFELIEGYFHTGDDAGGLLNSIDTGLQRSQEGAQRDQQHQPEQPGLAKADDATEQRVAKADHRYLLDESAYRRCDNMQNQHYTEEQDGIRDQRCSR